MSKRYNTPHRTHIIKTRVTEEEHADFMERLTAYGMGEGNAFNIRDIEQFIRENLIQMDEFIGSLQSSEENAL